MKLTHVAFAFFSAALIVPAAAIACGDEQHAASAKTVTLAEVASLVKEQKAYVFDANSQKTREQYGAIIGAVMLSSSSEYDVRELPPNKDAKLVFYCANQKCQASHGAAKRALDAGYTDVSVMPDGIKGWSESGRATTKSQAQGKEKTPRA